MTLDLSPETWTQVRYEYEQTDKPTDDICLDHGLSPSTLRDRVRRWRWSRRRQPISADGPPPVLPIKHVTPLVPAVPIGAAAPCEPAAPLEIATPDEIAADSALQPAPGEELPPDPAEIVPRLQSAVARVLPAIEATLAKLANTPMAPREMERAARTLTSLTRTVRELNELLSQHQPRAARACTCDMPEDIDAFRIDLARRIRAVVASQAGDDRGGES